MSTNVEVFRAVMGKLAAANASGGPLGYVKSVFEGERSNIAYNGFPAIAVFPDSDPEESLSMPEGLRGTFRMTIACFIHVVKLEAQITGDDAQVGILPFVDDVRNVITTDRRLGIPNIVQGALFTGTRYYSQNFPVWQADLDLEVRTIKTVLDR